MRGKHAILAAALTTAAMGLAGTADDIKAAWNEIKSNSVDRTVSCRYYQAWYRELCSEAEREAILERNIAAHRRWIALEGEKRSLPARIDLGIVLSIGGRYEEAEKVLSGAIADMLKPGANIDQKRLSEGRWALAECLLRRGDRQGAKKLVSEIATMPWNGPVPRTSARAKSMFLHDLWTDPDADIDMFKLPHSVDCKPFPVPQEAKYGEKKVSLEKVALKTTGLKPDDPIARLLRRKLMRFGSKFEKGGTKILIDISPDAPVDKPQGYSLDVATGKMSVKARTRLGATWGVVSLLQCVDRGALEVRECAIRDWPKLEKRGVITHWELGQLEYFLFNKMSALDMDMFRPEWGIVFSPLDREVVRQTVRRHNDFGISVFWSCRWIIVDPMLPITAPRVRDMHLKWMRYAAAVGANIAWEMDDSRFLGRPASEVAMGPAANIDAKHINGLYREVKAEYPNFRLLFGPPFYFGPDGGLDPTWYPEPREPYLKSIGDFMDPEIDVYWTGPRVKSHGFTVKKIKWFSDLIKRKQVIFHNADAVGRHNYLNYGADIPGYKASHCPETLDLIGGFYRNTSYYQQASAVGPAMDWCWNPVAHDAAEATRRTVAQLEGPGVFEILSAAIPGISYFDKYPLGNPRTELFTEDQEHLDKLVKDGEDAWKKVLAIAQNGGKFVCNFNTLALEYAHRIANLRRNPPKWLIEKRDAEMANTSFAKEEVGFDESKGDKFIPSELLQGGRYYSKIDDLSKRAPCSSKELRIGESISGKFAIEHFPPEEPPKLIVVCQALVDYHDKDFTVELPNAELEVNGNVVWRGKMFAEGLYKPCEIKLPVVSLLRNNTFSIRYTGPDVKHKRLPMVHYVVIRK